VAGSTGVLIPPKGYLARLREICTRHGILLIFDEVITGFGRLGTPIAANHFGVVPDMITMAKGLTSGALPMGAVAASKQIYHTFMQGPEGAIELFHGYTYSAHPLACAAGIATQQIYRKEGLLTRAQEVSGYWADAVHSLKGLPHVIDLRNLGLIAGIELEPIPGKPGARGYATFLRAFEKGLLVRVTGDIIALSPPLIIEKSHIDQIFSTLAEVLKEIS
jgi:beta-alanine--pyruvate transaminase